jgi:DNA-binding transcriptional MerR regulator
LAENKVTKSPDAFRTISEVADDLDLPQHVLRFWETRFNQIKPMKRGGGRRYYRPEDIDLLRGIKSLLYNEGYTIRGVQRLLKEQGNKLAIDFGKGDLPQAGLVGLVPDDSEHVSAQEAMDVSDYANAKSEKGKGLIGRITGRTKATETKSGTTKIASDDIKVLQSTLHELLECKRLLDQTRQD